MSNHIKTNAIKARKNDASAIVCLTAYTAPMAQILDEYCDLILVGDSMSMCLYGMNSTIGLSVDTMINHGHAVASHVKNACVVVDMPYGSYENSVDVARANARRIMDETGCDAVKLEGGMDMEETIRTIVNDGIPVMAHIGLQPQSVEKDGGYKIKGKTDAEMAKLVEDAHAVERAGAFAVVIEGTIESVAAHITQQTKIPTIGIGGSAECDGQILVTEDMLGMLSGHTPKFAKKYANISDHIHKAVQEYSSEVKFRTFPSDEYTYQG
ncbi:MAG: 3-methyl-2-oxobutanoate hydroxymethyltransferase [Alphaproteobacteria bacterium]